MNADHTVKAPKNQRLSASSISKYNFSDCLPEQLKLDVTQIVFIKWLSNTFLLRVENRVATVGVEGQDAQEWLTSRVASKVARILVRILDQQVSARFEVLRTEALG